MNPRRKSDGGSPVAGETLRLGYVPLVDAAPLIAASAWGCFEREGLRVELIREIGWGTIRDKLIFGELDAVPMPVPQALAIKKGLGTPPAPVVVPYILGRQGNAITLSKELRLAGAVDGPSLARLVRSRAPRRLRLGAVARHSFHTILLHRWLLAAGLDPARYVHTVVIPPPQMVKSLADGLIDGFCAGEPWNTHALNECGGWCPATSADILPGHPEKALVVTPEFAKQRPEALMALIRAIDAAAATCEPDEGRRELVGLLSSSRYLGVGKSILAASLTGPFDYGDGRPALRGYLHQFHGGDTHRPSLRVGGEVLSGMRACGQLPPGLGSDAAVLSEVFREDLHNAALATATSKTPSGTHKQ